MPTTIGIQIAVTAAPHCKPVPPPVVEGELKFNVPKNSALITLIGF